MRLGIPGPLKRLYYMESGVILFQALSDLCPVGFCLSGRPCPLRILSPGSLCFFRILPTWKVLPQEFGTPGRPGPLGVLTPPKPWSLRILTTGNLIALEFCPPKSSRPLGGPCCLCVLSSGRCLSFPLSEERQRGASQWGPRLTKMPHPPWCGHQGSGTRWEQGVNSWMPAT